MTPETQFIMVNCSTSIRTSTLDYNGDRYLSSIINRIPVIRGFRGACYVFFTSKIHAIKKMKRMRVSDTTKVRL
jgi:hypothetical protein